MVSNQDAVNPSFTRNTISGTGFGIGLYNVTSTNTITLGATNTISSTTEAAILLTNNLNFNPIGTSNLLAATNAACSVNINGIGISPAAGSKGVQVTGTRSGFGPGTQTVNFGAPTTINGGGTGLQLDSAAAISGNTLSNVTFTGQTDHYVRLTRYAYNSQGIDATATIFDGNTGATMTMPQRFATEDKIIHRPDNATLGLVTFVPNHVHVTTYSYDTAGSPATATPSVQRGINAASAGWTMNLANGTYNEDIDINKSLTLLGQSTAAIIRGLYSGAVANTVFISASNATLRRVTVTRDYGADSTAWSLSTKNQGISFAQLSTGNRVDSVVVKGNRNGIYINNAQSVTITNSIIDSNRTGIHFANNVSGASVQNNFIRGNFTHGVLMNYDTPPGIVATGVQVNNNSIINNWYSQVNFQHNNNAIPSTGDHTGLSFTCNWYGTASPEAVDTSAAEPSYASQLPSQFGGTDPGLNRQLYGREIAKAPYKPYLIDGTDNDLSMMGFQPVPASCTTYNKFYVNDLALAGDHYTSAAGNDLNPGTPAAPLRTIQHAIDVAAAGDSIFVDAGIFAEAVNVTKRLTILGSNAGINPNTGTRIAESNVYPEVSNPAALTGSIIMYLASEASGSFIDGFNIDGDNPALTTGVDTNLVNIDAAEGIASFEPHANTTISNNIVRNMAFGIDFFPPNGSLASGNKVTGNKLDNIVDTVWGVALTIYNNNYTDVTHNVFTRVRIGIQTGNFHLADTGNSHRIDSNNVESSLLGIWHNLAYGGATAYQIKGNTMTTLAGSAVNNGVEISSIADAVSVLIDSNNITGAQYGYNLWNCPTTSTVTINRGTVTNCQVGVFANNYDGYDSDADPSAYAVDSLTVNGSALAGLYVKDNDTNSNGATVSLAVTGNTIINNTTTGLLIEGKDASASFPGTAPASFTGQSVYIDQVTNGVDVPNTNIDATAVSFDGNTGAAMTDVQRFAAEDKLVHKPDYSALGLITFVANNVYVTTNSFDPPATTTPAIQRGINAASAGWTVNLANGTYNEDIDINKTLTVLGQSTAAIIRGLYSGAIPNTVFISASNATLRRVTVTRDYGADSTAWSLSTKNQGISFAQTTSGQTVDSVIVKGNRNGIYLNNVTNVSITNSIIDSNRTGVHFANTVSGAIVRNNYIRGNFTHGVLMNYDNAPGPLTLTNVKVNNNYISNNWYSDVNFQHNTAVPDNGDETGLSLTCNWYGTIPPSVVAANAAEPSYVSQLPSQFGGTDPGLNRDLYGTNIGRAPYAPYLTDSTDNAPAVMGFQPVPGSCTGYPRKLYVNNNSTADGDVYTTNVGDNANSGTPAFPLRDINFAISVAQPGDSVFVDAGTYSEDVVVDRKLVITGAGQSLTTVYPFSSDPNCGGSGGGSLCPGATNVFLVEADSVRISRLAVDGDNPANGTGVDARNGIITNNNIGGFNALDVRYVTVRNVYFRGIYSYSGTFLIDTNIVMNVNSDPGSIAIFNFAGSGLIRGNTLSNVSDGIATNHSTGTLIAGNSVTTAGSGIHSDNNGDGAITVADTIRNNMVTNSPSGGYGIWAYLPYTGVRMLDNTITNVENALAVFGSFNAATVTVTGNTVDGQNKPGSIGAIVSTQDFGLAGGPKNVSALFLNNYITNNITAFYLEAEALVTNTTTANENSITGNTNGVVLGTGTMDDGTFVRNFRCNWWGSAEADDVDAAADQAGTYYPFLTNGLDNSGDPGFQPVPNSCVGYPHNLYVNNSSTADGDIYTTAVGNDGNGGTPDAPLATISFAESVALNGDSIWVDAGTYADTVHVTKKLVITGAGQGLTTVYPAISDPNCGSGSLCGSNVFLIQSDSVRISRLTVDGDNPSLTSGVVVNGADVDARNGVATDWVANPAYYGWEVHHITVKNTYLKGIYNSAEGTFNIHHDSLLNIAGGDVTYGTHAILNLYGSGLITDNYVNVASDGIAANNSKGTVFANNTVLNAGGGISTDNTAAFGGGADTIRNNTITNGLAGAMGIRVYGPYEPVMVHENTITNMQYGLVNVGRNVAGVNPVFEANTINGKSLANSIGVVQSTDGFGFDSTDVAGTFTHNFIDSNTVAFYLESQLGKVNTITANENSIVGNQAGVVLGAGYLSAGTYNRDFTCNWWGTAEADTVDINAGQAGTYYPFLVNGTDNSGDPGFQPVPNSCVGYPHALYVNDAYVPGSDHYTTAPGSNANGGTSDAPLATMSFAISVALPGDSIYVDAGIFADTVVVNKPLTIVGSNAGIDPNTGTRLAESILYPMSLDLDPSATLDSSSFINVYVAADSVWFDGFTVDGDNPAITGGMPVGAADANAGLGITSAEGLGDINIRNNIVQNLSVGGIDFGNILTGYVPTTNNHITRNKVDNIEQFGFGYGISISGNFYAAVDSNVLTNVERGIQTYLFDAPDPGNTHSISDNNVDYRNIGIWHSAAGGTATAFRIALDSITTGSISSTPSIGILVSGIANVAGAALDSNVITGTFSIGIELEDNPSTTPVTIRGGKVDGSILGYGVLATNVTFELDSITATSSYILDSLTVNNCLEGVIVNDHPGNQNDAGVTVTARQCMINGSLNGFYVVGRDAHLITNGGQSVLTDNQTGVLLDSNSIADLSNITMTARSTGTGYGIRTIRMTGVNAPNFLNGDSVFINLNSNPLVRSVEISTNAVWGVNGDMTLPDTVVGGQHAYTNGCFMMIDGILNTGNGRIDLGPAACDFTNVLFAEHDSSYIDGNTKMLPRYVGTGAFNFMGVKMNAGNDLDSLTLIRHAGPGSQQTISVNQSSIMTYWDILPKNNQSRTGVSFRWLDVLNNGVVPSRVIAYRLDSNTMTWVAKTGQMTSFNPTPDYWETSPFTVAQFSSWTLANSNLILANLKAFLQGPMNSATSMTTTLRTGGLIPLSQPYSGAPFSYTGGETVAAIPANVTDWILVELRDPITPTTVIARRAGFILSNGTIVDTNGTSPLTFRGLPSGNYYYVVRHRNHLGIMTAAALNNVYDVTTSYDFTIGAAQTFGTNAQRNMTPNWPGVYAMWGGNANVTPNGSGRQAIHWSATPSDVDFIQALVTNAPGNSFFRVGSPGTELEFAL